METTEIFFQNIGNRAYTFAQACTHRCTHVSTCMLLPTYNIFILAVAKWYYFIFCINIKNILQICSEKFHLLKFIYFITAGRFHTNWESMASLSILSYI
jgi:hypothetical protein